MTSSSHRGGARVGLIGVGYIADFHARALQRTPGVTLAAVCDVSPDRARRFAERYGVEQYYASGDEMLLEAGLDAVHVLTPPPLHRDLARRALEAGVDVLVEKPLTPTSVECDDLIRTAHTAGRALGVSHNFLFSSCYERLESDLREGVFGPVDHVDIVWNKPLDQLANGPYGPWMFSRPETILFEVAPHSFAHVIRLLGHPERVQAHAWDEIVLPGDRRFYRRWEVLGWLGATSFRLRFCFAEGYPEHYIHLRGAVAAGYVDFEQAIYRCTAKSPFMTDVDRLVVTAKSSTDAGVQALANFGELARARLGMGGDGSPYERSIKGAVAAFHRGRGGILDARVGAILGADTIRLAEQVVANIDTAAARSSSATSPAARPTKTTPTTPTTLVIGGGGFIGRAVVKRLVGDGVGVRVLSRDPSSISSELRHPAIEVVRGDLRDRTSIEDSLEGIDSVVHLGRGSGKTWADYVESDVEPTRALAELCAKSGVRRLVYSSSIAIYDAGHLGRTIDESTVPMPQPADPYARSKVENEQQLRAVAREMGLGVVVVRPGVVLGRGASPFHWGIAAWPANSVARLWGDGSFRLPTVLVDDCADAIVAALTTPAIDGRSYNLVGPALLTARQYVDELARHTGVRIRSNQGPAWRHFVTSRVKWQLKSLAGSAAGAAPRYRDSGSRSLAATFDAAPAQRDLDWRPTSDLTRLIAEGIHAPADEWMSTVLPRDPRGVACDSLRNTEK